jgi:hypothetical protein
MKHAATFQKGYVFFSFFFGLYRLPKARFRILFFFFFFLKSIFSAIKTCVFFFFFYSWQSRYPLQYSSTTAQKYISNQLTLKGTDFYFSIYLIDSNGGSSRHFCTQKGKSETKITVHVLCFIAYFFFFYALQINLKKVKSIFSLFFSMY